MAPKSWYRRRGYLHFDEPVGQVRAERLVSDPAAVSRHSFYPLIKYSIDSEKVRRDPASGQLAKKVKNRPISYASHLDSHIYSYYAAALAERYERKLARGDLGDCVLAFRSLGISNIGFAKRAFDDIRKRGSCVALAFDITGFFDNLDHALLKEAWRAVLGRTKLPRDHFAVYRSLTRYAFVNRSDVFGMFGISEHNSKAGRRRICSPDEFREHVRGRGLIQVHDKKVGIPQGTAISAILSNIYMLPFDKKMKKLSDALGGTYLRYCDDILMIVPKGRSQVCKSSVSRYIESLKLKINRDKTETSTFVSRRGSVEVDRPLQYLGFMFDGNQATIRSAAFARFSNKMKRGVRLAKKGANARNTLRTERGLAARPVYRATLLERYSHVGKRNFIRYGYRAAEELGSPAIRRQLKPWWGRLVEEIEAP